jgi:hypothetical protein
MRKLLALLTLVLLAEVSFAQSFYAIRKSRSLILVAGTGTSTYFGELSNPGDYLDAKLNINAGLQYYLSRHISIRSEVTWFTLEGSDAKSGSESRIPRNLSFKSSNFEFNVTGAVNLFANGNRYYRRPSFNVYGFAGIGFMYFNPKTEYQGQTYALQPLQTEGVSYNRSGLVIPYGLGARFKVGPNLNISIEGGYRTIFTDYLDDVSGPTYADPATLSSDLSRALADRRAERDPNYPILPNQIRGNPDSNDGYFLLNIKAEYYLPWDLGGQNSGRTYSKKRSANYRYNKKGGIRRR